MSVRGYVYRAGGLLHGHIERFDRVREWNHHGALRRVASASSWSPHYICSHCNGVYVQMGDDLIRCETPDVCVMRPLRFVDRRSHVRPRVQAGPMCRGLL